MAFADRSWPVNEEVTNDDFNDLEQRIKSADNATAAAIAAISGAGGLIPTLDVRLAQLEADMPRVKPSANSPAANTYTLQTTDIGTEVQTLVNATAKVWTLNNITAVAGSIIVIGNNGSGTLTIAIPAGLTLRSKIGTVVGPGSLLISTVAFTEQRLRKESAGFWKVSGELG